MNSFIISNLNIVTSYDVLDNAFIYVKRGIIEKIGYTSPGRVHRSCNIIDGQGRLLLPGIIDLYNCTYEKGSSFYSVESRLIKHGVTTVCHSMPVNDEELAAGFKSLRKFGIIRQHLYESSRINENYTLINAAVITNESARQSNIKIEDIVENFNIYAICSDNAVSSILDAVFILHNTFGMSIAKAAGMASINPSRAYGLDSRLGSIEYGKSADFVVVSCRNKIPEVEKVFVSGCKIYDSNSFSEHNVV